MPDISPPSSADPAAPLRLADLKPFGVGGRRRCFVHPDRPDRCVKVARRDGSTMLQAKPGLATWLRFGRVYDNNADELKELSKLQRKLGEDRMMRHFPRLHGMAPTDLGPGLVTDLVRDADGRISQTLRELLVEGRDLREFRAAYDSFGRFLIEHGIVTRDLLDHNLVVRQGADGARTFFLIDGFGDSAWFSPGRVLPAYTRRRIEAKLAKAWARFERLAADLADPERAKSVIKWRIGFLKHR
jgi:hypothetical protein